MDGLPAGAASLRPVPLGLAQRLAERRAVSLRPVPLGLAQRLAEPEAVFAVPGLVNWFLRLASWRFAASKHPSNTFSPQV